MTATPSINTHILLGRVSTEPDLRHTQSGMPKLSFRVKTDRPGADGKVWQDSHNVVWWGPQAEKVAHQLKMGDIVQVTGRVGTRGYTSGNGDKKWITETTARDVCAFGGVTQPSTAEETIPEPLNNSTHYTADEEIPF